MTKTELEGWLERPVRDLLQQIQHRIMHETSWFGVKAMKNPMDFWIYQELMYEQRPDVVVEIGNNAGGSTLAFAHLCDLLGHGRVIGVDLRQNVTAEPVTKHPRITLIDGEARACFPRVAALVGQGQRVLVIEDSSHTYENTLAVLRTYSRLVQPGGYFIVEDGICHHGLNIGPSPGPYEAIETFLNEHHEFEIDMSRESFLITWNPHGFLRRYAP